MINRRGVAIIFFCPVLVTNRGVKFSWIFSQLPLSRSFVAKSHDSRKCHVFFCHHSKPKCLSVCCIWQTLCCTVIVCSSSTRIKKTGEVRTDEGVLAQGSGGKFGWFLLQLATCGSSITSPKTFPFLAALPDYW